MSDISLLLERRMMRDSEARNILLLGSKGKLALGALEDGIADFHAVGYVKDAGLLALAAVFKQQCPVRHERLLHRSVIQEFLCVFHGSAPGIALFVLQPEHAQRSGADVITRLSLVLIGQVDHEQVETFLLIFPDQRDRRATLFVTQQRIDAVMMLGDEAGGGVLSRREGSSVNDSP